MIDTNIEIPPEQQKDVFERCHFTCVYCGFDGRTFDGWMQLSVDHVRPWCSGGTDIPENVVAACRSCNSITSRMKFSVDETFDQIIKAKREKVAQSREASYQIYTERVVPHFLKRPLPDVLPRPVPEQHIR